MTTANVRGAGHSGDRGGFGGPEGPGGTDPSASMVRCPQCLQQFRWNTTEVYNDSGRVDLSTIHDALRREEAMHNAFVRCPGPPAQEKFPEHYLPLRYVNYGDPLVIGLVGGLSSGKTTYLAMLVDQIDRGGLARYGIEATPLHQPKHDEYCATLSVLLAEGAPVPATPAADQHVQFAVGYLMTNRSGHARPVAFFDVGGESLANMVAGSTRFVRTVGALIFVVDPEQIEARRGSLGQPSSQGDPAFSSVINRLAPSGPGGRRLSAVPAAEVLVKSDVLRYEPLIGGWLRADDARTPLDAVAIEHESRDVYAYLAHHGAGRWVQPFRQYSRCTLHVVSATSGGINRERNAYARSLRPRRVLAPLAAILAMTGVLEDPQAHRIGR